MGKVPDCWLHVVYEHSKSTFVSLNNVVLFFLNKIVRITGNVYVWIILNACFLLFMHNITSCQRDQRLLHKKCFQKPYDIDTPTSTSAKIKWSENFKFKPPTHRKSKATKTRTVHVFHVLEQFFENLMVHFFVHQFFFK